MGIRALELDIWWCSDGEMRMEHLPPGNDGSSCNSTARLYSDGIKEIADWLDFPGNEQELVQVYINEKRDQGHDDEVNGPLEQYLGRRMLTPAELRDDNRGVWPTMRQMRKAGKTVVVVSSSTPTSDEVYTHGDIYIHKIYWKHKKAKFFTNYPTCGTNMVKCYSRGTHFGKSGLRWYNYACQSANDPDDWTISASPGPYSPVNACCLSGYKFSAPQDGCGNQQFSKNRLCCSRNDSDIIRYYTSGTHQRPFYDGTKTSGIILDFTEYVKCRVPLPAADFITPELMKTAIFTWAEGEPSTTLTADSCVWISKSDWRWYLSSDCSIKMHYACQNTDDPDDWTISASPGPYGQTGAKCPAGYKFSVPQDGYRNQQLRESAGGYSLWINYSSWLPKPVGSAAPSIDRFIFLPFLLVLTITVYTS